MSRSIAIKTATGTHPVDSTVELAEGKELADVAGGNGLASKARPSGNGHAREGELQEGLELAGLLGELPADEQSHGWPVEFFLGGVPLGCVVAPRL